MAGREHLHNTFFMVYYFGPAEMRDRKLCVPMIDEPNNNKLIKYGLEDRIMGINESRYVYTVGVLDCPRQIVEVKPRKPKIETPQVSLAQKQAPKQQKDEQKRNVVLVYACAPDEIERRELSIDVPNHWL